ncbi:MAG: Txe/YoeB family addiction module toxin [Bacteroidaceae bacterium]|nr:Txe/YoeB family addiction module toxin [Bacteroidaceae bacterium]MBR1801099.1 Txe/YoeB family addiction module toxin [Bacteroidaceae bacterium]
MSRYFVEIKEQAQQDLKVLSKSEPKAFKKALELIAELYDHPQTGTGKPEQLKGGSGTMWSRRITKKHRLIYEIFETEVYVDVLSAYGHYDDK